MKWSQQETDILMERMASLTGHGFAGRVDAGRGEGLRIDWTGGAARVTACDVPALCRALLLLARAQKEGRRELHIAQERHIASCGSFVDCSRGAVMTVAACRRAIDATAALGLNLLALYTEDTYTVPEYPYFGHLRGRYTPGELREIDRYAGEMGVELIPCIQTLAHLGQFLQWKENERLKDTQYCLLIDDEETYAFIEAEIRAMRGCVSGRRLHIGMDEANGVGLARYYSQHGPVDRFDLLKRHLERVVDICRKYDFEPMMWSDMFFRLGSKDGEYYDPQAPLTQRALEGLPPVEMVYWDYHHDDEAVYDYMFAEHARMGEGTVFAGGIWNWSGFLPNARLTEATMLPALRSCLRHGIQTVIATTWGDDGNETDFFLTLSQLPLFSEACWQGEGFSASECAALGAFVSGLPQEAYRAFSLFYPGAVDDRTGKGLVYCDPLYPLLPGKPELGEWAERLERARGMLAPLLDGEACRYADAVFDVALGKARMIPRIRACYAAGDREGLREVAEGEIPVLMVAYERLIGLHRAQWEASYRRNGWELFALRYGAVMGRLRDVQYALRRYADGELETLCELEEPELDAARRGGMQWYCVYTDPKMT